MVFTFIRICSYPLGFRVDKFLNFKKNTRLISAKDKLFAFDLALKKNPEIWTENQHPFEWSFSSCNEALDKIVTKEKVTQKTPKMNNISKQLKVSTERS